MSTTKVLDRKAVVWLKPSVELEEKNITDYIVTEVFQPEVIVKGNELEIDSTRLEVERVYPFDYLGVKMVLWKLPDETIDIFQIVEE